MKSKQKQPSKRFKRFKVGLCLALAASLALTICGCGKGSGNSHGQQTPQGEAEMPEAYTEVLDAFYCLVTGTGEQIDEGNGPEGINGVIELTCVLSGEGRAEEAPECVGYTVKDISGDGVPELIIGDIAEKRNGKSFGSIIYAIYTLADEKPYCTLEGWQRNRYDRTKDGRFFNRASAGAAYTIVGDFTLSKDGTELVCRDYWFTYNKDDNYEEIAYFYNTTGQWDMDVSEEISPETFYKAEEELEEKIEMLELTPFADYTPSEAVIDKIPARLNAAWAEDVLSDYEKYDEYIADDASGSETVVFYTDKEITDFKVLELIFEDADEDGNITFSAGTLYKQKELMPECPLAVTAPFYGSIPNWGISYRDADGSTHNLSVSISGMDGSVLLDEIKIHGAI